MFGNEKTCLWAPASAASPRFCSYLPVWPVTLLEPTISAHHGRHREVWEPGKPPFATVCALRSFRQLLQHFEPVTKGNRIVIATPSRWCSTEQHELSFLHGEQSHPNALVLSAFLGQKLIDHVRGRLLRHFCDHDRVSKQFVSWR